MSVEDVHVQKCKGTCTLSGVMSVEDVVQKCNDA